MEGALLMCTSGSRAFKEVGLSLLKIAQAGAPRPSSGNTKRKNNHRKCGSRISPGAFFTPFGTVTSGLAENKKKNNKLPTVVFRAKKCTTRKQLRNGKEPNKDHPDFLFFVGFPARDCDRTVRGEICKESHHSAVSVFLNAIFSFIFVSVVVE